MNSNLFDAVVAETEPHDQIGLLAVIVMLAVAVFVPQYAILLIALSVIVVVGVLVDLTAHGWSH